MTTTALSARHGAHSGHGTPRGGILRIGAAVGREMRIVAQRRPRFECGAAALARRGIAVWEQALPPGIVRHDVVSIPALYRAAGSATARHARAARTLKSSTFSRRRPPRGRFEQELVADPRLARLGASACRLQRPSGASWALPQRGEDGRNRPKRRAAGREGAGNGTPGALVGLSTCGGA